MVLCSLIDWLIDWSYYESDQLISPVCFHWSCRFVVLVCLAPPVATADTNFNSRDEREVICTHWLLIWRENEQNTETIPAVFQQRPFSMNTSLIISHWIWFLPKYETKTEQKILHCKNKPVTDNKTGHFEQ